MGGRKSACGVASIKQASQAFLGSKLFAFHLGQALITDRLHTRLDIADLTVQLTVPVIQLAELRVLLQQDFDFMLLTFEHRASSWLRDNNAPWVAP
jgi:hypothetical protein